MIHFFQKFSACLHPQDCPSFEDLVWVDARLFHDNKSSNIEDTDSLDDACIYTDWLPYLALRSDYPYDTDTMSPQVLEVFSLCQEQLSPSLSYSSYSGPLIPDYLDI